MAAINDFDPLAGQDLVEKAAGLLARRKMRSTIKPVSYGCERVFVDSDGVVHAVKGPITAGERYWTSGGSWLSIDVADHSLTYSFAYRDLDGTASYRIDATVTVRVVDAVEVVRRKIRGVRAYIEPALRTSINEVLTSFRAQDSSHNLYKLNARRGDIERQLVERLQPGRGIKIEDWLSVRLADLNVTFDSDTAAHYDTLVSAARGLEIDAADRKQRTEWAQYFEQHLTDPLARAVQIVSADPSQENVERVVGMINADEKWRTGEAASVLKTLIDKNYFDNLDQLKAGRVLLESLLRPEVRADRALGPGISSDLPVAAGEVIDSVADVESPAHAPAAADSANADRTWRD